MIDLNDYWVFSDPTRKHIKVLLSKKCKIIEYYRYEDKRAKYECSVIKFTVIDNNEEILEGYLNVEEKPHEITKILGDKYLISLEIERLNKKIEKTDKALENLKKRRDELVG